MGKRKKCLVLLSMIFLLFTCWPPLIVHAEVEWSTVSTLDLDQKPIDVASTPDGKWVYILTAGQVQVYSLSSKSIEGRISVDNGTDKIAVSTLGDQLFLTNERTKTLSIVKVGFIQNIDVKGSPFKGPAGAPVVIAVFEDFQWPYCARLSPLLQQVLEQYPKEVKLVSKHYPIPSHAFSRKATAAVLAAAEQGKYWEYQEKIFANMSALSDQKFIDMARELGLNMDAFQKSLKDPKHQSAIDKDVSDANLAGVRGTPTIFINGRLLTNRSLDGFKEIINEELKKKK